MTGERRLSSAEYRNVIGHFASGVTIVTTVDDATWLGTTANAVCSLSLEPPMILVCLNQTSETGAGIACSRAFGVNILGEGQRALAEHFAGKRPGKFDGVAADLGPEGQPLLADALAHLECRVVENVTGGTHTVFIAEVERATVHSGAPLAYFRGRFGRLELADVDAG